MKFHFPIAQEYLEDLVLSERVEIVTPLNYILVFLMAYYGPNAEILGNVKLSLWHFRAVTDLEQYLGNIILLFVVDFSSAIICGIILWTMCKINMFKTLQSIQKDLWHYMAISDAKSITDVNISINNRDIF